jgi:predicted nucleotide-binding protein
MNQDNDKRRHVFVIHGRNEAIRQSMFIFLRAIGLSPIEWSEAAAWAGGGTPYVGEILEAAFDRAQASVVILTGDDEARLQPAFWQDSDPPEEKQLTPQARPNVLFEAGMALARYPRQTVLVQVGNIRSFSDVSGRHILHLDSSPPKRQELAQRLRAAGCDVKLLGTDWYNTGEFRATSTASLSHTPFLPSSTLSHFDLARHCQTLHHFSKTLVPHFNKMANAVAQFYNPRVFLESSISDIANVEQTMRFFSSFCRDARDDILPSFHDINWALYTPKAQSLDYLREGYPHMVAVWDNCQQCCNNIFQYVQDAQETITSLCNISNDIASCPDWISYRDVLIRRFDQLSQITKATSFDLMSLVISMSEMSYHIGVEDATR